MQILIYAGTFSGLGGRSQSFRILGGLFLFVGLTLGAASQARAQTTSNYVPSDNSPSVPSAQQKNSIDLDRGTNEFGVWGGSSLDLPRYRGSRGRDLPLLIGLRYGRVLFAPKAVAIEYTFDLLPAAVVTQPIQSSPTATPTGREHVYGAGFSPFGFKATLFRRSRVKPFAGVTTGPIIFTKQVPIVDSARFNFLSNVYGGIQIRQGQRNAITIGYEVGHISNAGISKLNPGFNNNYIYLGFSTFR